MEVLELNRPCKFRLNRIEIYSIEHKKGQKTPLISVEKYNLLFVKVCFVHVILLCFTGTSCWVSNYQSVMPVPCFVSTHLLSLMGKLAFSILMWWLCMDDWLLENLKLKIASLSVLFQFSSMTKTEKCVFMAVYKQSRQFASQHWWFLNVLLNWLLNYVGVMWWRETRIKTLCACMCQTIQNFREPN